MSDCGSLPESAGHTSHEPVGQNRKTLKKCKCVCLLELLDMQKKCTSLHSGVFFSCILKKKNSTYVREATFAEVLGFLLINMVVMLSTSQWCCDFRIM